MFMGLALLRMLPWLICLIVPGQSFSLLPCHTITSTLKLHVENITLQSSNIHLITNQFASSPTLLSSFFPIWHRIHLCFHEAQLSTITLTKTFISGTSLSPTSLLACICQVIQTLASKGHMLMAHIFLLNPVHFFVLHCTYLPQKIAKSPLLLFFTWLPSLPPSVPVL